MVLKFSKVHVDGQVHDSLSIIISQPGSLEMLSFIIKIFSCYSVLGMLKICENFQEQEVGPETEALKEETWVPCRK